MINLLDSDHIKKQRVALIAYMRSMKFFYALAALNLGEQYHCGERKDGVMPEFMHQIQMALFTFTLKIPEDEFLESLLIAIFTHDLFEDYDLKLEDVQRIICESVHVPPHLKNFIPYFVLNGCDAGLKMSKIQNGKKLSNEDYFKVVATNCLVALMKGIDRINNIQTMGGVFSSDKQKEYLKEAMDIINALKRARKLFPSRAGAFFNIEYIMKSQIELISRFIFFERKTRSFMAVM